MDPTEGVHRRDITDRDAWSGIARQRDISSATDSSTGRLVAVQNSITLVRPQPPPGVKYASGVLTWDAPSNDNVFTHYRIRIDNESDDPIQVPSDQRRYPVTYGGKFFVSTYNATIDQESSAATASASDGVYVPRSSIAYYTATASPTAIANTSHTPGDGDSFTVFFLQDGTGNRVPSWGTQFKNAPTTIPTDIDGTANTLTTADFRGRGGSWYCVSVRTGLTTA